MEAVARTQEGPEFLRRVCRSNFSVDRTVSQRPSNELSFQDAPYTVAVLKEDQRSFFVYNNIHFPKAYIGRCVAEDTDDVILEIGFFDTQSYNALMKDMFGEHEYGDVAPAA